MRPGVRLEGWLRWFAHSFGGVQRRRHAQYCFFCSQHPVFCSWLFRHGIGFFWPLHISVQNFPKLRGHTVIFQSLTLSRYLVAQGEVSPGASFAAKSPRSQAVSGKEQMEAQGLICSTSPQGPTGQWEKRGCGNRRARLWGRAWRQTDKVKNPKPHQL